MGDRALLERHGHRLSLVGDLGHEHQDRARIHALARDQPLDVGRHPLGLGSAIRAAPEADLSAL